MTKRVFDIIISLVAILFLFPLMLCISLFIVIDSKGGIFFFQQRVGKGFKIFNIYKFRTMYVRIFNDSNLTVGEDSRITRVGKVLRKHKLDEIPQLFNVLFGQMSIVGPRPDVLEYAKIIYKINSQMYNVKPGITDYSSLYFINENEILSKAEDYKKVYVEEILPKKVEFSMKYITNCSIKEDLKIMYLTFKKLLF